MPSRVPALAVQLPAGQVHEFYLRVRTDSSVVLPIRLSKPSAFLQRESRVQMAQGLIAGVALAGALPARCAPSSHRQATVN